MNLGKILMLLAIAAALMFVIGFWRFAETVRAEAPAAPSHADGIVALTGGSMERLSTGVQLLQEGRGDRLLISGVNRIVTDEELFAAMEVPDHLADCCVDIGRGAEDTIGNASETAAWARRLHYTRIILVTDDYHMPRSRAELALAMPDAEIYPYPVRTRWTDPELWRSDVTAATRLGAEYVKFLMIRGREAVIRLSRSREPESADAHA